jgi:hypothetical protein
MISESSLENLQELNKINARKGFLEASGYLYHFAPKSMRETLLEKGFTRESAKKAGASFVEDKILHFYTNPFSSIYSQDLFTSTYSEDFSVGGLKGEGRDIMDLYRVPVNKEILQGLSPDPNILSGSEIYTNDAKEILKIGKNSQVTLDAERFLFGQRTNPHSPIEVGNALISPDKPFQGLKPQLFIPGISADETMAQEQTIGGLRGDFDGLIENLEARLKGFVTLIGDRETVAREFSGFEKETINQTLKELRTGVMSRKTLKNVVSSTETAIKVARGIL